MNTTKFNIAINNTKTPPKSNNQIAAANLGLFILVLYTLPGIIGLTVFFLSFGLGRTYMKKLFPKTIEEKNTKDKPWIEPWVYHASRTLWPFCIIVVLIFFLVIFSICSTIVYQYFLKYLLTAVSEETLGVIVNPWSKEVFTRDILIPPPRGRGRA